MKKDKLPASRYQLAGKYRRILHFLKAESWQLVATAPARRRGFTLIETMVAITILTISIVAPMALTVQSLEAAYYARDEVTAENLGQEGIETVRAVRDGNILLNAEGTPTNLFAGIPLNTAFTIDPHNLSTPFSACGVSVSTCSASQDTLETNGQLYGYSNANGWTRTNLQRYGYATVVWSDSSGNPQEIRLSITVTWQTSTITSKPFTISENLYNWLAPGSAVP